MKNVLLIVDDDETIVFLMKNLFEKNYIVFTASNGAEALTHLSEGILPNLIITDLMMDYTTGFEFIKQLSAHAFYKKIPVIVVSATSTPELLLQFPSVQFVKKPFNPGTLKNLVDVSA